MQWWTAQQLRSKNPAAREQAVHKLAAEGSAQATASLIEAVRDYYPDVRKAAVRALGRLREAQALPVLVQALRDQDAEVREHAVNALRDIGDLQAVDAMVAALEDPHAGVRWHAAKTLERFGWQPRNDVERLRRDVALGHFVAAAQVGSQALDPLLAALGEADSHHRRAVIEALGQIEDEKALVPLLTALKDGDANVRVAAVEALGSVRDSRLLEPLRLCLNDPEAAVRAAAAGTLGSVGDPTAVPSLIKSLTDGHWTVRKAAIDALSRIGVAESQSAVAIPQSTIQSLAPLLHDPDHDVREAACRAFANLGGASPEGPIEWLVAVLTDTQTAVRHSALSALRKLEPAWAQTEAARRAIPRLQSALKDREYWVRHAATEALQRIQNAGGARPDDGGSSEGYEKRAAAFGALVSALSFAHPDFRQAAAEALGRIADPRAAQSLMPLLSDFDKWVRHAATDALGKMGYQAAA